VTRTLDLYYSVDDACDLVAAPAAWRLVFVRPRRMHPRTESALAAALSLAWR